MGPSVAIWIASGEARPIRRAISRRLGSAKRRLGSVGRGTEGNPSGERKSMVTPSLRALRASEVKVRTTPLTWGCQASVATSTFISRRAPVHDARKKSRLRMTAAMDLPSQHALETKGQPGEPKREPWLLVRVTKHLQCRGSKIHMAAIATSCCNRMTEWHLFSDLIEQQGARSTAPA